MTGLALGALRFFASPIGKWLLAVLGALAILFTLYNWVHGDGEKKGAARVQATIDKPVTGWSARLSTCQASNATLQGAVDRQTVALQAKGADDAKTLAAATQAVAKAQESVKAATEFRGVIRQPLPSTVPVAATQGSVCPVDTLTAARLVEIDRRATQ